MQYPEEAAAPRAAKLSLLSNNLAEVEPDPAIGLVVPFDMRLDAECWRWLPANTSLYITRTPRLKDETITVELAQKVSGGSDVSNAVDSLVANEPAVIAYGCSSGSFVGGVEGEEALRNTMLAAGAPAAVTTSGAMAQALKAVGAKTVAIATPYTASLTALLGDFLEESGFEVVSNGYLNKDGGIFKVSYDAVRYLAAVVGRPEADAIFFSCTNMRTFDILEELEKQLGKPVLSANQVTMWAALKAANIPLPLLNQSLFKATDNKKMTASEVLLDAPLL